MLPQLNHLCARRLAAQPGANDGRRHPVLGSGRGRPAWAPEQLQQPAPVRPVATCAQALNMLGRQTAELDQLAKAVTD